MSFFFASINSKRVIRATLRVPYSGIWIADLDLDTADVVGGPTANLVLGALTIVGTISDFRSGTFGEARKVRVIGGKGGWSKEIPPKHYRNDAGLRKSIVLQESAALAGETLNLQFPEDEKIGPQFTRVSKDQLGRSIPASNIFAKVIPTYLWWTDFSGVTQVATSRPTSEVPRGKTLELLEFDARHKTATLAGDFDAVSIGTILRNRLDSPITVREISYSLEGTESRIMVRGQ